MSSKSDNIHPGINTVTAYVCNHQLGDEFVPTTAQHAAIIQYCKENKVKLHSCFVDWQVGSDETAIASCARDYAIAHSDALAICGLEPLGVGKEDGPEKYEELYDRLLGPIRWAGKHVLYVSDEGKFRVSLDPISKEDDEPHFLG